MPPAFQSPDASFTNSWVYHCSIDILTCLISHPDPWTNSHPSKPTNGHQPQPQQGAEFLSWLMLYSADISETRLTPSLS